jgi:hypothetical protein
MARGVDTLAHRYAQKAGMRIECYPAGPIRNKLMLTDGKPDVVIAFPGGAGTANMVGIAKKANIDVIDYR